MNSYSVIGRNGEELHTVNPIHPGEVLLEEIEEREIKKSEFAFKIGILPNHLSELFSGKRNISAKMALKIERELGIAAEVWMRLQMQYDLDTARHDLEIA